MQQERPETRADWEQLSVGLLEKRPPNLSCAAAFLCLELLVLAEVMKMKGDERSFSLMFRGCSFLQVYEAGVVKALQDLSPEILKSASKIYGISSGSIVAAFAACECDIDEMQQYLYRAQKLFLSTLLTARGKVLRVVKDALNKFLPANAHQLASGKLHIVLTRLHDWNCVTVSEFASKEDIIQRYIDGEFSMWKTNFVSQTTITVSALAGEYDICPRDCPVPFFTFQIVDWILQISEQNLYRIQCLFQCPSAKVCEQLYHDGYQDAVSFLHRLNAFGIKYLPEDFMLPLHKELCEKGEGTLHRKPGTGVPCSRARLSGHHQGEHSKHLCSR
ncbi:omega-hydroxyceramide transacylase-like isoform X2 [Gallus gallus]|uniref:omega-hydroxyceramide transacylase-like isoform X2 n=1 Tax=Gallus gallus TaxID=9031 RepID=UPI001AE6A451|nr:omega-hydroxyceramide transacylase-like isoform X2 [Gallus gallus]XP_040547506.1 omega-hydroxyceramide transacylase-like isoform X2 [Gallus gallus]